jgi:hypothetical protein
MFRCCSLRPAKRFYFIIFVCLAALAANIGAFSSVIRQPFNLDEVEEATMGRKFGLIGPAAFLDVPGGGEQISHPLLYTFSHALVQRVFGPGEIPLRVYGVVHYLISFLLVILIARKLIGTGTPGGRLGIALSGMLFISNPLLLQHSVIVNADNNILTTLMLLFMYFFVSYEDTDMSCRRALAVRGIKLGVLFALCLWAKLLAPLLMAAGIVFARVLNRQNEKTIADIIGIAIFGTALFWCTWYLYCAATGTDVMSFIHFTLLGKGRIAFSPRNMDIIRRTFLASFRWPVYWVSAPFFVLVAAICVKRAWDFIKKRKLSAADMILTASVFIWVPFQFFRPSMDMMKYQYPAYPFLFIVIGYAASKAVNMAGEKSILFFGRASACITVIWVLTLYHYYRLGDYILALWRPMHSFLNGHFLVYYYLPLGVATALVFMAAGRGKKCANVFLALVFLVMAINSALLINQAAADYITAEVYQNYGESGFRETVAYLKGRISPGMTVASRWDVAYYLRKEGASPESFMDSMILMQAFPTGRLRGLLTQRELTYVVLDQVFSPLRFGQERIAILSQYFVLEKKIGSFYVFRKK